ncbi:MAG TPA: efflux RND transporter periplasmic adaptor subunit [Gemmatimonadaceae bacterium]|nr:efflux RND transporter periplasmic adaptor subunit [Gemmatimonadaceae bacterium]
MSETIETLHERSPFGEGGGNRALRMAGYGALFVATAFTVYVATRRGETVAATRHDHAAAARAAHAGPVMLDANAARRIGVTFAAARIDTLAIELRATGQLTWDETRVRAISSRFDGWVEQLHVDFTGRAVSVGEPLFTIYSPMLVAAQEELLLAARLGRDVAAGSEDAQRSAADLLASARRRLMLWNIPEGEIDRVLETGMVTRSFTIRSPMGGVVVEKSVLAGQRIMAGETLFRVADLGTIWVEGQVFERDLGSVRTGVRVDVEVTAYPGERWTGTVTYIHPTVDATSRTARVRVELRNPGLRLKPGMYATLRMKGATRTDVLTVPRTAVLASGERVIAFVRRGDGSLEPREIRTGLATDDRVEVLSGLAAGDTVVASATFLVDAESNLGAALGAIAKPSEGRAAKPVPVLPNHENHQE